MPEYREALNAHYGQAELGSKILAALLGGGTDIGNLKREDLEPLDQFHIGGLSETRNLAQLAGIHGNMHALDVGCGIGGPARTLAAEFGCRVTGIDMTEEFVRAAEMLTNRVGLGNGADFRCANALDMPFGDETFDLVWMQHVTMNIEDKGQLFSEVYRVSKSRGRLALFEICSGTAKGELKYPVPWASEPALNFLVSPDELDGLAVAAGFEKLEAVDKTAFALEWFQKLSERAAERPEDAPAPAGLQVIMPDFPKKAANVIVNLREKRVRVIQRIFDR